MTGMKKRGIYAGELLEEVSDDFVVNATMCLFFSVNATDSGYFRAIEPENLVF